ncbi:MAG: type 4a pilus biogenesis protein PilO [Acidobacteriota bacterium]|nr:type 4a pilus biogenesis protein PilO [Blastocatellia bacterium]MDW8411680.1 type 4a pilus biogenesis protein PilO [Acidobacteriota bacterium]
MRLIVSICISILVAFSIIELAEAVYLSSERGRLRLKKTEVDKKRAENDANESLQKNSAELEAALRRTKQIYQSLSPLIPQEAELPEILSWLAARAADRGLKLEYFSQSSKSIDLGVVKEIQIQVEVLGYYDAVSRFVEDFSRFKRILRVNSIKLVQEQEQQPTLTVRAYINASAFLAKKESLQ